jgi:hypothetical protein
MSFTNEVTLEQYVREGKSPNEYFYILSGLPGGRV